MKRISAEDKRWLQDNWLPRIQRVTVQRRPIKRLMIAVLTIMTLLFLLAAAVPLLGFVEFHWGQQGVVLGLAPGIFAIVFAYLGKIQACDDQLPIIDAAVCRGDWEILFKAIGGLTCYSKFSGIIGDVQSIVKRLKP